MLSFLLMLQFVTVTRAGMVNYVEGPVNVSATQTLDVRTPIKTGTGGFAEILLNPGSYLRLAENSEAMLEGVEMPNIGVRIVAGAALIQARGFDKRTRLNVISGNLKGEIIEDGIFLISDGKVLVLDGKIQIEGSKNSHGRSWQLSNDGSLQAVKFGKRQPTPLEAWSRNRSEEAAQANYDVAMSLRQEPNVSATSVFDVWLWSRSFGGFTYMPGNAYRSPYGHSYLAVKDVFVMSGLTIGFPSRASGADGRGGNATTTAIEVPAATAPTNPTTPVPATPAAGGK
jgi:hypothetical protein